MTTITITPIELATLKDLADMIYTLPASAQSFELHGLSFTDMTPEGLADFREEIIKVHKKKLKKSKLNLVDT